MDLPKLLDFGAKVYKTVIQQLWYWFEVGRVLEFGTAEYVEFIEKYKIETLPGTRSIIIVDIHQVGTSCGFSVPYYDFKEHRPILNDFFEKKREKFDAGNEKESMDRYVEIANKVQLLDWRS